MITVQEQVQYILLFLLFGAFLAVMYDVLHYYLNRYHIKTFIGYILEFVYWLGLSYVACLYMMRVSKGYLTIYTFGFFLLGILIHIYFFSDGFVQDLAGFDRWMSRIVQKVRKAVIVIVFPEEVFRVLKKILPKKKHLMFVVHLFYKKKTPEPENGQEPIKNTK